MKNYDATYPGFRILDHHKSYSVIDLPEYVYDSYNHIGVLKNKKMSVMLKTALFYWSGSDEYESTMPINFSYGRVEFMNLPGTDTPGVSLTGFLTIDRHMTDCLPIYKKDLKRALYDLTGYTWDILQSWHEDTRETMPGYNVYWLSLWTDGNHS